MKQTTADKTIEVLRNIFSQFGLPETLVSDNGPPFTSSEFESFIRQNGIKHITTAPYHPASNGLAENAVKLIKGVIKKANADGKVDMDKMLDRYLFNYRVSAHSTTEETPAKLMFNRQLRTRFDLLRPQTDTILKNKIDSKIVGSKLGNNLFETGDTVLAKDFSNSQTKWRPGIIADKVGQMMYDVNVGDGKDWRRHSDQLLPSIGKRRQSLQSTTLPVPENVENKTDNGNVDKTENVDAHETVDCVTNEEICAENGNNDKRYNLRSRNV